MFRPIGSRDSSVHSEASKNISLKLNDFEILKNCFTIFELLKKKYFKILKF